MLHRPMPEQQKTEQAPREEEIKFDGGGGGGGPPKAFFKSFSSVSSVTCRPDPENPGKQICTRTEKTDSFDPFSGHSSRQKRSEETQDAPSLLGGFWDRLTHGGRPAPLDDEPRGFIPMRAPEGLQQKPSMAQRM